MSARRPTAKSGTGKGPAARSGAGFTPEERAAMRDRVRELKAAGTRAEGERAVRATLAKLPEPDRTIGTRLHAIIGAVAPSLTPRLWYGMPAYAKDDKVVCFFQAAQKFKTRYATLGFMHPATLDDGAMWPVSFALLSVGPKEEARIRALVKQATS